MPILSGEDKYVATQAALRLRVAALWGATVVEVRELQASEVLRLSAAVDADPRALPCPGDLLGLPSAVLSPASDGWRFDGTGAKGGFVECGGARVSILEVQVGSLTQAGDFGVLEYTNEYSVFFQTTRSAPRLGLRLRPSRVAILAIAFSCLLLFGALAILGALTFPLGAQAPLGLGAADDEVRLVPLALANSANPNAPSLVSDPETQRQLQELVSTLRATSPNADSATPETQKLEPGSARFRVWDRTTSTIQVLGRGQGLTDTQVKRVLGSHMESLQTCLSPDAKPGKIVVRVSYGPDGSADSASMTRSSLRDPSTERCVLREARRLSMPAAPRPTAVLLVLGLQKT